MKYEGDMRIFIADDSEMILENYQPCSPKLIILNKRAMRA
jgi:hypothetical protein